jgi:hypothetical protein
VSGVLKTIGKVAGIVATVAAFIPGGQPIAAAAAAVAAVANVGAAITAKPPPARGSVNGITIGTDQPSPYMIGRTYFGGARQQQVGYGPTTNDVPNPYALAVDVYSAAGPIDGYEGFYGDFASLPMSGGAATGYASGFLWTASQLGLVPEAAALSPHFAGAPGWGADYKLSGKAAVAWSFRFDRKGKVFASGLPQTGVVARGVKVYDPRLDDTYPGGLGPQRITSEATWTWSENPGLHGLAYAYGRYHMGMKVFGVGIPVDGLRVADFVHLANVCDANGWKVGGVLFEPGNKWNNLKDILAAAAAEPCFVGGRLGVRVSAPRIALDTITIDDLADGEVAVGAMQGWEDRLNTLIPKYRSEPHKWEYVQSTVPVTIASYVVEDGEVKQEERQINLVQDKDQASQLCAYELLDGRELGDIDLPCKPRLRRYGPGDLLIVDLPEAGLEAQPCIVMKRSVDPATMAVRLILRSETMDKHAFALSRTGIAPATPSLLSTQDRDVVTAGATAGVRGAYTILGGQTVDYPVTSTADSFSIVAFDAVVDDGTALSFPAGSVSGLTSSTVYVLFYSRGTASYLAETYPASVATASSDNVRIEIRSTSDGAGSYPESDPPPPGYGGGGGGGRYERVNLV